MECPRFSWSSICHFLRYGYYLNLRVLAQKARSRPCEDSRTFHSQRRNVPVKTTKRITAFTMLKFHVLYTEYDEWHWTAYAYVDTKHDDNDGNNINEGENAAGCSQDEIDEDPIACGGHASHLPIWRPRQYFLKAFEARIQEPKREWDELVHLLEVDITKHVCSNVSISENLYKMWSQVLKLMPCRTIHLHITISLAVSRKDLTR